ncbi:cobalt-precorrin-7 (C5)-methyltransferase [Methanococcus voltae PS]|uniref:Cobalt-precorrin-7 (C5)-methyltransferase n=1 Tax=Methanococcus voltae PS TaxID=523842 RepID=A0ABT2EY03_METVO|nr:cobalt-precorrin-7 (C(5))-methyltransferase [Methanococcus voltae]MCS3922853.1 cobalt-precorrin-7 (C5)-methyltransferase [Methanococcus voltae PS]
MIYIIGIGAGSSDLITLKALDTIEKLDILVGSKRSIESIKSIDSINSNDLNNKEIIYLSKNLKETLKEIAFDDKFKNKDIGILSTGDPCFSGLLKTMINLGVDKKDISVISGISSIQVACARLKISWDDYAILTLHGKEHNQELLYNMVINNHSVIFLPSDIKKDIEYMLNKNNVSFNLKNVDYHLKDVRITICENLSYPNEKISTYKLGELLKNIENGLEFSYMAVCIITF